MAHVKERLDVDLENPVLVEGLPGVGLVGKIAADHLVDEFDMELFATVHCESLAPVAVYHDGDRDVQPPVRIYVAPDADLLVLQSDVPVNAEAVGEFADCLTAWFSGRGGTAVYLSGMAAEKGDAPPAMHGVGTGEGVARLEALGLDLPSESRPHRARHLAARRRRGRHRRPRRARRGHPREEGATRLEDAAGEGRGDLAGTAAPHVSVRLDVAVERRRRATRPHVRYSFTR